MEKRRNSSGQFGIGIKDSIIAVSLISIFQRLNFVSIKTSLTNIVACVDQDQAAQNVQPDLRSTLSAILEQYRQKLSRNLPLSLSYCRIKISIGFIGRLKGSE